MKLKNDVATSESGFVFNAARGESFTTNPIGVDIIRLLKEKKEIADILESLEQQYEIDAATLEKDLYDFLKILKQYNLLEE
ncbi:MAG: PqqD family protein [Saprospirales bacterium]|nr:PqqD family protein [Saprospirales bacterium]MBK8489417.1 PqqD family protein [Saprospirales bacterium]